MPFPFLTNPVTFLVTFLFVSSVQVSLWGRMSQATAAGMARSNRNPTDLEYRQLLGMVKDCTAQAQAARGSQARLNALSSDCKGVLPGYFPGYNSDINVEGAQRLCKGQLGLSGNGNVGGRRPQTQSEEEYQTNKRSNKAVEDSSKTVKYEDEYEYDEYEYDEDDKKTFGLETWVIVAIAIGAIVLVISLVTVCCCCCGVFCFGGRR